MTEPTELELVLDRRERLADDVVALTLRHPDGAPLPGWAPGAHIDVVLPGGLVRQYSLCGDPDDPSAYRVAVLREPNGRGGSRAVHDELAPGDRVPVRGPRNHFPLVPAPRYLFLAGGIGITPILPMIERVAAEGADWRLAYGGRSRSTMAFRDVLDARHSDRVTLFPMDECGPLDLPALLADPEPVVYCCGPEGLLRAVEEHCRDRAGGPPHVERFSPRHDTDDALAPFEVELAATGTVLHVPADRSILQVVTDAGVPVLSSCQEGTCGTCETDVLGGIPHHRDSILTDEERAAGDTMMICVSRARSARLVLDL